MSFSIFNLIFLFLLLIISAFSMVSKLCFLREDLYSDQPFECGVLSLTSSHKPFSIIFFYITLVFLLFDVEIMLIVPFLLFFNLIFYIIFWMIFMILMMGLITEWMMGSLKWF